MNDSNVRASMNVPHISDDSDLPMNQSLDVQLTHSNSNSNSNRVMCSQSSRLKIDPSRLSESHQQFQHLDGPSSQKTYFYKGHTADKNRHRTSSSKVVKEESE